MQATDTPTAFAGSPKQIGRVPFSLTLHTDATAYCPGCGRQLNHQATSIKYGIAWCTPCATPDDDYALRIAMMIICERTGEHFSTSKGVTFFAPRLNNPGSYPALLDRLAGGDGRTDIPDYGNPWPRWIPPHAEVIIYAIQHHLLHPDVLISDVNVLNDRRDGVALTVLEHGTR